MRTKVPDNGVSSWRLFWGGDGINTKLQISSRKITLMDFWAPGGRNSHSLLDDAVSVVYVCPAVCHTLVLWQDASTWNIVGTHRLHHLSNLLHFIRALLFRLSILFLCTFCTDVSVTFILLLRPPGVRNIAVTVSVCLSVCLSVCPLA